MTNKEFAQSEYEALFKKAQTKKDKEIITEFFTKAVKHETRNTDWGKGFSFEVATEYGVIFEHTYYGYTWQESFSLFIEVALPKYKEFMS